MYYKYLLLAAVSAGPRAEQPPSTSPDQAALTTPGLTEERSQAGGLCQHASTDSHGGQAHQSLEEGEAGDRGACQQGSATSHYGRGSDTQAVVGAGGQGGGV